MLDWIQRWGFTASIAMFVIACAPATVPRVTECVVSSDQNTLFKGHWTSHPIPLAVIANDFSASELAAIQTAIESWNNHFQGAKGFALYLTGSSALGQMVSSGTRVTSATACSQTVVGPTGFTGHIMIYKNTSAWSFGPAVIGVTSLCPIATNNSTYRMFVSAVMEINWIDYFRAGKPVPDLQSVILHELGHLLGLDHSCNGTACNNASDGYREAVMYPALGFDGTVGRQKRVLQSNDQGRANCLY